VFKKNATYKKLERWEHEALVDQHREHMKGARPMMIKRSSYVEHPFGTLKHRAGMHHFLMRGLEKCRGEFSLMALCYNFTGVLNILGVAAFRDYCAQRLGNGEKTKFLPKMAEKSGLIGVFRTAKAGIL
jgi:hypothetical protein